MEGLSSGSQETEGMLSPESRPRAVTCINVPADRSPSHSLRRSKSVRCRNQVRGNTEITLCCNLSRCGHLTQSLSELLLLFLELASTFIQCCTTSFLFYEKMRTKKLNRKSAYDNSINITEFKQHHRDLFVYLFSKCL